MPRTAFGAFIEIMPGTEGLLHISEMQWGRTERTEDVVKKGDRVKVKLIERDERGRLRLSRKVLLPKPEGALTLAVPDALRVAWQPLADVPAVQYAVGPHRRSGPS